MIVYIHVHIVVCKVWSGVVLPDPLCVPFEGENKRGAFLVPEKKVLVLLFEA